MSETIFLLIVLSLSYYFGEVLADIAVSIENKIKGIKE